MRHLMLKTCVAGVGALGLVALGGPAYAVSSLPLTQGPSLLIQVEDMETEAVEEDLRPDEMPDAMEGEQPMMEPKAEESDGMEEKALEEDGL